MVQIMTRMVLKGNDCLDSVELVCQVLDLTRDDYLTLHFTTLFACLMKVITERRLKLPPIHELLVRLALSLSEAALLNFGSLILLYSAHPDSPDATAIVLSLQQRALTFKNQTSAGTKACLLPICYSICNNVQIVAQLDQA